MVHQIIFRNSQKLIKLPTVLVLILFLGIFGCASTKIGSTAAANYDSNPLTVAIPAGLSPDTVEKAMVTTVTNRKWILQSQSQNEVIASLDHRAYDATVTLQSDGSIITIHNDATHTNPNTGETKPGVPLGWLTNIQNDLQSMLNSAHLQ